MWSVQRWILEIKVYSLLRDTLVLANEFIWVPILSAVGPYWAPFFTESWIPIPKLAGPYYLKYLYIRDQHKCHDDPDLLTLRQLPGKGLGAFLEGIRFTSTRQKVNKCLNRMHEIMISGSRLSRCRHSMPRTDLTLTCFSQPMDTMDSWTGFNVLRQ